MVRRTTHGKVIDARAGAATAGQRRGPVLRILLGGVIAMGPGKAALLEAIRDTGSISQAARTLGMSYRRAWLLVDAMNRSFRDPLVEASPGGEGGGGAHVTPAGLEVLKEYRTMESKAARSVAAEMTAFSQRLRPLDG